MKKLVLLIAGVYFTANTFAQVTIQSFTVSPANPTTNDYVKVYVDLQFSSGGCGVDNQGDFTNGLFTDAYATHCLGMLTFICNSTDTFNLGYLQAGYHTFRLTLNTGQGGPGCSAGIVPDDVDSTHFTVSLATGVSSAEANSSHTVVYPNPATDMVMLKINQAVNIKNAELKVTDNNGRTMKVIEGIQSNELIFKREDLSKGIYFYQLIQDNNLISSGKFILD